MFEIGSSELVLVFVIALLVLGPEKLPVVVRQVVTFIKKIRAITNAVIQELSMDEIKEVVLPESKLTSSTTKNEKK